MSDLPHEPLFTADHPTDAGWEALGRFLAGESDAAEAATVAAWLAAHPEDAGVIQLVKDRSARFNSRADVAVDTERALAAVRARLAREDGAPALSVERGGLTGPDRHGTSRAAPASSRGPRWGQRLIGFAAAAGLAVVAFTQLRDRAPATALPREYRTAIGQRDSISLPDGSTVVLAPGSRLTLAADYGAGARALVLEGAAYFDVKHDDAHPFVVRAAAATIRDIGTAFTVKTAANGSVAVHVTHGIVEMAVAPSANGRTTPAAPAAAELRAGDRGVLAAGTVTVSRGVVTADDVAWTRGQLSYRDASLAEVQADLQRWYGLDLRVTDSSLARRTLTASFRGDSVAQVVRVIALALGADLVQHGDTVLLQPQGSGPSPTP